MVNFWYTTGVNHIKSDGLLEQRRHPFSTCERGARTMSDHIPTPQQMQEIPYGYCHCGCGQLAPIAKRNDAKRGHVKGEPIRFLPCHVRSEYSTIEEAFWAKFTPSAKDECWLWQGALKWRTRYGRVELRHEIHLAHRVSYELHNGPIPEGLFVCHRCDNPSCVNPAHLFLGTPKDNTQDMVKKGRGRGTFDAGENHPAAKLTGAQVSEILSLRNSGLLQREIGERYGVSRTTVGAIWRGVRYATLEKEAKEEQGK